MKESVSSIVQLQNVSIFIEKAILSNLTMFVLEILQVIVINFSYDMIRTRASFPGHTLSVKVQTNHRLKLPKNIGDMALTNNESLLLFLLQGR